MKLLILLTISTFLVSCASINDEEGSYLRVSQGSYGAKLLQWAGLAAQGDYCQLSHSERGDSYVWTTEDLEFIKEMCAPSSVRDELILQLLNE